MAHHTLALVQVLSLLGQLGPAASKAPATADKPGAASKPVVAQPAPGKPSDKPAAAAAAKSGDKAPAPPIPAKPGDKAPAPQAAAKPGDKAIAAGAPTPVKPSDKVAPAAPAPPKPRPRAPAPVPARAPEAARDAKASEIDSLRSEVAALRAELSQAVGAPPKEAAAPVPDPNQAERERLAAELSEEKNKLAAIQKAVDGGLDRAAVADSIARAEARIKELEAALEKLAPPPQLPAPPEAKPPSLHETNAALRRVEAKLAAQEAAPAPATSPPASTSLAPGPTPPAGSAAKSSAADEPKALALLPLEFTAFGDFYYQFSRPDADGFYIGAIELDAALKLSDWVNVATAIVFNGADDEFALGAFVIDCGILGQGDGYPLHSKVLEKSGVSFGKFDVPFGAAYLEYPAVSNRLVTQPQAVLATHGGWNDIGAQGYALAEHWTGTAYLVNGPDYPTESGEDAPARSAAGGRLSAKALGAELGGSGAWVFGSNGAAELFAGADLGAVVGPLDVRAEYLLRRVDVEGPDDTHGIYGRAILKLEPAFLVGRYETVLQSSTPLDRRFTVGGGVEIFPQGEVRAVYEQSVESDARMVLLQLVGGSTFQPTGLRR
ncbi:MAG TPA: hypothetical protein VG937_07230 [Polyangiaceae bacterium]|nr:hypothetical protein [Polyangiaceae bacterium]